MFFFSLGKTPPIQYARTGFMLECVVYVLRCCECAECAFANRACDAHTHTHTLSTLYCMEGPNRRALRDGLCVVCGLNSTTIVL